ncbi:MAG: rhodanese-like domain-containing protein [Limnohabitans sp.]|uniref:rhodanese-like domain-containing protein n=1 Tax=Limnohabitans sp. TaxID=1907725 RepID=UPI0025D580F1|nr:rhodanese-like domain-containing protein [Limnohabitans sp.]MCO4089414.1 rhodanese-like domain-containing protein [Limnohabitans sp.]
MNFLLENWMLLAMTLASGLALLMPVLKKGGGLDPQAMVQLMNREKAVVIDVCEPDEFSRGHVIGAKNLPLAQVNDKLPQWVKNKSTPVIMVCQVGARSSRAAAVARKLGYENAHSLSGGLRAWVAASMPTEKA